MRLLLWLLVFVTVYDANSLTCRSSCSCSLDAKGRHTVLCKEGGIVGPLDFTNISLDTEVLKITAPDDNMNSLTIGPFTSYKKLEEIHITRSNIPELGQYFFYGLHKLDILNLSQNNITQPLDRNFRGLSTLKELYLDDNRIYSLPSGTFRDLRELKLLSIQRNRISTLVTRSFLEIGKLKVLKLSGNNLQQLNPEVFKDVQELRLLECRGCALKELNNDIYHLLPHLNHLDLGANEIKSITPDELKDLSSLKTLRLDANQLTAIKGSTFTHLSFLKKLDLSHNEITKLSKDAFADLTNLTELDLSYNHLESIDNDIWEPIKYNLQILTLSGNHLKANAFESISSLELVELRLRDCGIANLQFLPPTLNILDLSNNHLSSLSNADLLPEKLTELDISQNLFRGIDEESLERINTVLVLKLEKNPWSCDLCHIVPLLNRVNISHVFHDIICAKPYTVHGKKLGKIRKSELTWCTGSSYNTASDANFFLIGEDGKVGIVAAGMSVCLLLLTILAIIGALLYSRRHAARYYTHEDKLAVEGESIFENHSPLFCDGELSFKFPLEPGEKRLSISTIDEIKKEHAITNGT